MARAINGTATNKLKSTTTPITAVPLTMACWFNLANVTTYYTLMSLLKESSGDRYFIIGAAGATVGDPLIAEVTDGSTYAGPATTAGYTANTWHHGCATFTSNVMRAIYLNGGNSATNATNVTTTGVDRFQLGGYSDADGDFDSISGSIAECGVWNVVLTAAEILMLSKGFAPPCVRPDALVAYWPLYGRMASPEQDRWGNAHAAISGTVTQSAHPPRIFYPQTPAIWAPGEAGGGSIESGDGAAAVVFAGSGVGASTVAAPGSATVAFAPSGVGASTAEAAGAGTVAFASVGVGASIAAAAGSASVAFGVTAQAGADGAAAVVFAAAAAGVSTAAAAGSAAVAFGATALGAATAESVGSAAVAFTPAGTGAPVAAAAGAAAVAFGATAASTATAAASGSADVVFAAAAVSPFDGLPVTDYDLAGGFASMSF